MFNVHHRVLCLLMSCFMLAFDACNWHAIFDNRITFLVATPSTFQIIIDSTDYDSAITLAVIIKASDSKCSNITFSLN